MFSVIRSLIRLSLHKEGARPLTGQGWTAPFGSSTEFDQLEAITKLQPELPVTHPEKGNFLACVFEHFWKNCYIWHGK